VTATQVNASGRHEEQLAQTRHQMETGDLRDDQGSDQYKA